MSRTIVYNHTNIPISIYQGSTFYNIAPNDGIDLSILGLFPKKPKPSSKIWKLVEMIQGQLK